jgi:hypothetical protein
MSFSLLSARSPRCYSQNVIQYTRFKGYAAMGLLLTLVLLSPLVACHREQQAVANVAHDAVNAEHQAQAAAAVRDQQRAALALIPLPSKSMYVDVHEPGAWANPFLTVGPDTLNLRITLADANPSTIGKGTMLRPRAARRREIVLRPADLVQALAALPPGAWRYGRVVAVAESPQASPKDRPQIGRNVEAIIQQLNDLGLVVDEWPTR